MTAWRLALRLLRRDWRSGELYLLAAALVLTVAAITAVGFFTDRVEGAIQRQGGELIAADLAIDASTALPAEIAAEAQRRGLRTARTLSFRSVVMAGDETQLVEVKAVDDAYPLRGELRLQDRFDGPEVPAKQAPGAAETFVEPRLLYSMGADLGAPIKLGEVDFRATRLVAYEPDRGGNFFQIAPRVMINLDSVAATGLVGEASRVRHRLLVAGDPAAIADFSAWAEPRLPPNAGMIEFSV